MQCIIIAAGKTENMNLKSSVLQWTSEQVNYRKIHGNGGEMPQTAKWITKWVSRPDALQEVQKEHSTIDATVQKQILIFNSNRFNTAMVTFTTISGDVKYLTRQQTCISLMQLLPAPLQYIPWQLNGEQGNLHCCQANIIRIRVLFYRIKSKRKSIFEFSIRSVISIT